MLFNIFNHILRLLLCKFIKNNGGIIAAEGIGIIQGYINSIFPGLIWYTVNIAFRVRRLKVYSRRDYIIFYNKCTSDCLNGLGCAHCVAKHRFYGTYRDVPVSWAKHLFNGSAFILIIGWRACAMSAYIIYFITCYVRFL